MPEYQARISYPGIRQIESASITLAHGITASRFLLNIAPQAEQIELQGDLVLEFGNETQTFFGCRVDSASMTYNQQGMILSLVIADRRIDWAGGAIFGRYNVRYVNGAIYKEPDSPQNAISDPERTPVQLAKLLLDAMGEQGYDVSGLEDYSDARPLAIWEGEPPARLLADLCDQFACRVVLGLDNKVRIVQEGDGAELPIDDVQTVSPSVVKKKGRGYGLIWGPTLWQLEVWLNAVGLDVDDQVKPVNDLSYKPAGGWQSVGILTQDDFDDNPKLNRALASVGRWFAVDDDHLAHINDYLDGITIEQGSQVVVFPTLLQEEKVNGVKQPTKAVVFSRVFQDGSNDPAGVPDSTPLSDDQYKDLVARHWSFDQDLQVVIFSEPVVSTVNDQWVFPSFLFMRCTVAVRDQKTGDFIRGVHPPGWGVQSSHRTELFDSQLTGLFLYQRHDEISRKYMKVKGMTDTDFKEDNRDDAEKESQYYIDALNKANVNEDAGLAAQYAGWIFPELDGAIQSITWTLGISGATTYVQRNDDKGSPTTKPYKDRRIDEQNRALYQAGRTKGLFGQQFTPPVPNGGPGFKYPEPPPAKGPAGLGTGMF